MKEVTMLRLFRCVIRKNGDVGTSLDIASMIRTKQST